MVEFESRSEDVFRAIADPTRRAMLERLTAEDLTVSELAEPLDMSLAAASKHLGVLEGAGLVTREKRGRERVCSFDPSALLTVRDWVERYVGFWNERLDALDIAIRESRDD